jgi:maltoporin
MKLKTTVVCAAVLSALSTAAGAVDWNGYFRAGPGQKEGDFRCFGANMEGGTYRLGNECHTYGEFALSQGGEAGGVSYKALLMTNFFKPGSDVGAGTGGIGVNQLYLEGKGYDVAPNQTFWIGRRFYGRADVHMVDTFFVNMSGTGAGVDGVSLGGASVNFAAFRDDQPLNRLNVDVNGIAINPGGTLRVTGVYTKSNVTNGQDGFGISLQHNQSGLLFGGDNTLWLQYSSGSAYLNMGGAGATEDRKRWRLVESMTWTKGPLTAQALVLFGKQDTNNAGTSTESFNTFGGRVAYARRVKPQAQRRPDRPPDEVHDRTDADRGPELLRSPGAALLRFDVQVERCLSRHAPWADRLQRNLCRLPGRNLVLTSFPDEGAARPWAVPCAAVVTTGGT